MISSRHALYSFSQRTKFFPAIARAFDNGTQESNDTLLDAGKGSANTAPHDKLNTQVNNTTCPAIISSRNFIRTKHLCSR
ncbi:hypothetical protein CCP4SC76_1220002 [Gammaproteobacteria bacterium]